jgi:hypothetical protein
VKYELHDKAWASDLRRGRREALKWKRRVLRSKPESASDWREEQ